MPPQGGEYFFVRDIPCSEVMAHLFNSDHKH